MPYGPPWSVMGAILLARSRHGKQACRISQTPRRSRPLRLGRRSLARRFNLASPRPPRQAEEVQPCSRPRPRLLRMAAAVGSVVGKEPAAIGGGAPAAAALSELQELR